jgi:glycosyltransferase involved in cell wall biosynthesis
MMQFLHPILYVVSEVKDYYQTSPHGLNITLARERLGMKILLSAYACEPNKGSEPGVGWNWALALTRRGYDVHVITRSNNRPVIEQVGGLDPRLTFHYFDLPTWGRFWKYWPGGIYLYYLLWQIGAYRLAKRLHAAEHFEVVQHITFVSYRQPSFMGALGIPFIFGPVGGGETMPTRFRKSLPFSGRLAETIRSAGNAFVDLDPLMRHTYSRAQMIACATGETLKAIPAAFRNKCIVQRAIGIDEAQIHPSTSSCEVGTGISSPQFLFVGRLLYWKGLHLALRAYAQMKLKVPDVKLRVIGEGSDERWLKDVAMRAGVADFVEWILRKPHDEILQEYRNSAGFIFPSLHDSGGMVVLEALATGLPVICLDIGGPGSIVTPSCGFSLKVDGLTEDEVVKQLSSAMIQLATDFELRIMLAAGSLKRARELTWDAAAEGVYSNRNAVEGTDVKTIASN